MIKRVDFSPKLGYHQNNSRYNPHVNQNLNHKPENYSMPFKEFFTKEQTCDFLSNITGELVTKYNHFREFLEFNRDALTQLAELEQLYYGGHINLLAVRKQCDRLLRTLRQLVQALDGMGGGRHRNLLKACDRVEQNCCPCFIPDPAASSVIWSCLWTPSALRPSPRPAVRPPTSPPLPDYLKLPVPPGFAITSYAFRTVYGRSQTGRSHRNDSHFVKSR